MDKTAINKRVTLRYNELMEIGKHGIYETIYKIVHEERAAAISEASHLSNSDGYAEVVKQAAKCGCCGLSDVRVLLECHNSACANYAEQITLHEGWEDAAPTPDGDRLYKKRIPKLGIYEKLLR